MYTGLVHLHNVLRWVILILLLIALFRHLGGMNSKRSVNAGDRKIDLFLFICVNLMFLLGFYQWIAGPWGLKLIQNVGMGEVMKNAAFRFWAVEHPVGMIVAIALISIGRGAVKRATDAGAHKKAFWMFLLALIIILASIPWPFREAVARPLLPGM